MSGDFSAEACNCPRTKGQCPHCGSKEYATFSTYCYHIDRCHRKAVNHGDTLYRSPVAAKSIPSNASHQAVS